MAKNFIEARVRTALRTTDFKEASSDLTRTALKVQSMVALEISAGKLVDRTLGENEMAVKEQLEMAIRNLSAGITPEAFEADMELVRVKAQVNANVALVDQGLQVLTVHFLKIRPQG